MPTLCRASQVAAFAILLFCTSASLTAQDSSRRERARVDYVLLDVLAYDRHDRPVTDLTIADFVVFEGRKKIRLVSLDILDMRMAEVPPPGESAADVPSETAGVVAVARHVIVTDLRWVGDSQARKSLDQLERFLVEDAPDDANVAYHWLSLDRGPMLDGFTRDLASVVAAVREYRSDYLAENDGARQLDAQGPKPQPDGLTGLEQRFDGCRVRDDLTQAMATAKKTTIPAIELYQCLRAELDVYLAMLQARTQQVITDLEALAYRFDGERAPVSFLLVSPGFSLEPGRAAIDLAAVYYDRFSRPDDPDAMEQPAMLPDPMNPFGSPASFKHEFRRVIHACTQNRVTFHTFDMYNFNMVQDRKSDQRIMHASDRLTGVHGTFKAELNEGLVELARQSGGFFHSASTLKPLSTVLARSRFVYTLGYPSPSGKPGKFRKIKIKCKRSGVELRYRTGYYGDAPP